MDEHPYQFTHDNLPSVEGYVAFLADLNTRRIYLDDDNNDQNDAISNGDRRPVPRRRHTTGLTGVLHWSFAGQSGTRRDDIQGSGPAPREHRRGAQRVSG